MKITVLVKNEIRKFCKLYLIVSLFCCCARAGCDDLSEIINLFNNISWRILANHKIADADNNNNWITQTKYNESIIKVIAQAVADCVTDKNEFARKNAGDVITFNANARDYKQKHWNAVVLYNYLHVLKHSYLNGEVGDGYEIFEDKKNKIFNTVKSRICAHYLAEGVYYITRKVTNAISNIKAYDKALSLSDEMTRFYRCYEETKGKSIDALIQEQAKNPAYYAWMPVGFVRIDFEPKISGTKAPLLKLKSGKVVYSISMKAIGSDITKYDWIRIKEEHMAHNIYDYEFNICGGGYRLCQIQSDSVSCYNKTSEEEKVRWMLVAERIRDLIEALFSGLKFRYAYDTSWCYVTYIR